MPTATHLHRHGGMGWENPPPQLWKIAAGGPRGEMEKEMGKKKVIRGSKKGKGRKKKRKRE